MNRLPPRTLLPVLGVSALLLAIHFTLLSRSGAFGLWTAMTLLLVLGWLQQIGLPVLTGRLSAIEPGIADPSRVPGATTLGTFIIIAVWWGVYFLITLGVTAFIRYLRRDAPRFV